MSAKKQVRQRATADDAIRKELQLALYRAVDRFGPMPARTIVNKLIVDVVKAQRAAKQQAMAKFLGA